MRQLPSSVYVLESHAAAPPLPPRAGRARCSGGPAQALLLALLSVALIGLVLEGLLIFYLHSSHFGQTPSPSFSKSSAEQNASPQTSKRLNSLSKTFTHLMEKNASSHTPAPRMPLSKPVARLMDGADVVHGKGVMGWSLVSDRILRGVDYKDRSLVIRREGFYFVYSKVSFYERGVFHHAVMMRTRRHPGGTVLLLQSRKYSSADDKNKRNGDTFLAGVFHLHKDDAVFVKVSDTSKIVRVIANENVFGAFMI
ncbi:tumor necrosis factor ligand superfamily member 14 isoform X2 [Phyllopteryx taeniolatus]|uniref:tumor necrosis factor ligand superfamily member 14 isoform X2 n=1 Tax=Phyllopteryx taeniolatus TaxID=161469 RepID=UPI002AD4F4A3|nr:tumor necrosis factor ligand superfamily member 14 isoform X2 [Phyllopteryx taeniolatus]